MIIRFALFWLGNTMNITFSPFKQSLEDSLT